MWTDFNNSFTIALQDELTKQLLHNLPPQLKSVVALPCEIAQKDSVSFYDSQCTKLNQTCQFELRLNVRGYILISNSTPWFSSMFNKYQPHYKFQDDDVADVDDDDDDDDDE